MANEATSHILSAIKSFLEKTANGIEQIAEGIDDIDKAVNTSPSDVSSTGKGILDRSKNTIDVLKKKGLKKKTTAIGLVQEIIADNKNGLSIDQLLEKSGLKKKQVYNIVSKLKERGLLFSISRGVYSDSPNKPVMPQAKLTAAKKGDRKPLKTSRPKKPQTKPKASPKIANDEPTNMDIVLRFIENADEITIKDLETQLALQKKQIQNVIFKLKKAGRIESPRRGVYRLSE